jgi:predicted phage terminase large subunit-like protein
MAQRIAANAGPQTNFLESPADIVIYGGGGGGGKTFALLMDPLRNVREPDFESLIFRRIGAQIWVAGGLWSSACKLYPTAGGYPFPGKGEWRWKNGFRVGFRHLEDDAAETAMQGAQIPCMGFDELTHFDRDQFLNMLGRSRSTSGIPGRIRATTNPDADSWVKKFVRWWLDEEGQFADPAKAGKVRWMVRDGEDLVWFPTRAKAEAVYGEHRALSVTFIPALLADNPKLTQSDPTYLAKMRSLSLVLRKRLELGDWKVRSESGKVFRREWFPMVPTAPQSLTRIIRYWDRAATKPTSKNPNPDWTVGLRMGVGMDRRYYVTHVVRFQGTPGDVKAAIRNTTLSDGPNVEQWLQHDPGQAGKVEANDYLTTLPELGLRFDPVPRASKLARAEVVSPQVEVGNVMVVQGDWTEAFLSECESFPDGAKDDQVDCLAGAFARLAGSAWGEAPQDTGYIEEVVRGEDRQLTW